MAVTPGDTDEAFLREVDEGVRADQFADFWKRWGSAIIGAVVLFLAVLGGWLWWQGEQVRRAGVAGEQFTEALAKADVGDAKAPATFAEMARTAPGGYRTLAVMEQAASAAAAGDAAKASRLYDSVANDTSVDDPLRNAALLRSVRINFDTLPPAQIIARLKPLAVPGDPWFAIAAEMTALAQIKAGQIDAAKIMLTAIIRDPAAPPTLKNRVQQLALSLGVAPEALTISTAQRAK